MRALVYFISRLSLLC